jgi:hypothetical protein
MKITKRQLRRIIKEEKARLLEGCGAMHGEEEVIQPEPAITLEPVNLAESGDAEQNMLVEMEVASRSLEQVVESVQNAAQLCSNCAPEIAASAPLVEALATQAEALQEMLEAQAEVVLENVTSSDELIPAEEAVVDAVLDVVS